MLNIVFIRISTHFLILNISFKGFITVQTNHNSVMIHVLLNRIRQQCKYYIILEIVGGTKNTTAIQNTDSVHVQMYISNA